MKKVVISQPMFLPWAGIFEQIKLADIYVHYDDVQLPLGRSFMNRVQIKTCDGVQWLTAPIKRKGIQLISNVEFDNSQDWRNKHLKRLRETYAKAPFGDEMVNLVEDIYSLETNLLSEFNSNAIEKICRYFNINCQFIQSSKFNITLSSTEKLLKLVKKLNGDTYITGHGAKNYFDYDLFESNNIKVEFMDYKRNSYPQIHGEFTPYVSIIDLIANEGVNGVKYINSNTKYWRDFINE